MTELYWRGQDDVEVFHDTEYNVKYHPSQRPHDVPDERVEYYLSFTGWERELSGADEDEYPEEFEALSFVDDTWQSLKSAILDGEVDPHLEDVEEAELARKAGPRKSVLGAIEDRREMLGR